MKVKPPSFINSTNCQGSSPKNQERIPDFSQPFFFAATKFLTVTRAALAARAVLLLFGFFLLGHMFIFLFVILLFLKPLSSPTIL